MPQFSFLHLSDLSKSASSTKLIFKKNLTNNALIYKGMCTKVFWCKGRGSHMSQ